MVSGYKSVTSRVERWIALLFVVLALAVSCTPPPPDPVVVPQTVVWQSRGQELLEGLAACGFCHGESREPKAVLAGGLPFIFQSDDELLAPNITSSPTGIGEWSDEQIAELMRGGEPPSGVALHPEAHRGYEWLSTPDLFAIVSHLRSVPPIAKEVPRPEAPFFDPLIPDLFDDPTKVAGYVPEFDKELPVVRGKYLVDHVARCGSCHNGPETFFSNGGYLAGGRMVQHEGGEKLVPDISGSAVSGLSSWTKSDFVKYLQTGVTAEGRRVDSEFCPVDFYRRASLRDLEDIAAYLHRLKP